MPPEVAAFATLTILTLNLHTWQEPDQLSKFHQVADFILANRVDIVCFQECAQHKDSALLPRSMTLRADNAAHLIAERLAESDSSYTFAWDWAHYGWNVWEEGVAVLSRFPIRDSESRWVSESRLRTDPMGSRKVLRARIDLPGAGAIDVYTAHLSWANAGLGTQLESLNRWIAESESGARAVIVAGDFNDPPEGIGAAAMTSAGFGEALTDGRPGELAEPAAARAPTTTWGTHIDYIYFRNRAPMLEVTQARIVFNGETEPVVSDHFGILAKFRIAPR